MRGGSVGFVISHLIAPWWTTQCTKTFDVIRDDEGRTLALGIRYKQQHTCRPTSEVRLDRLPQARKMGECQRAKVR